MKPILFSTAMVQAILAGRKTMTRRIVKSRHESGLFQVCKNREGVITEIISLDWDERNCEKDVTPKYVEGDLLYVRETWQHTSNLGIHPTDENAGYIYKASDSGKAWETNHKNWKWKPSLFMPKDAARIFLKVTKVRCERLQDITEDDAIAEGIEIYVACNGDDYSSYPRNYMIKEKEADGWPYLDEECFTESFKSLWCSINGNKSWEENPFVWVIEFKRVERPNGFR